MNKLDVAFMEVDASASRFANNKAWAATAVMKCLQILSLKMSICEFLKMSISP